MNWCVRFRNHTSSVQGVTGPHTFVYTASGASTGTVLGAVRTAGIRKCRLCQSASYWLMNWHLHFVNRTLSVQETTGPPIFAYTGIGSPLDPVLRNVHGLTTCVQRFQLCQSASRSLVKWHVRFRNHTPSVQSTARPPMFVCTASGTCTCECTGNVQSHTSGVHRCH